MPPSANQVVRERKAVWRALKRQLKAVDSSLEKMERLQNRILARKRKVPEIEDLQRLTALSREFGAELLRYSKLLETGYPA